MKYIPAHEAKSLLSDGNEVAFLDVREHGQYGEGHPFFSVNLPYSQMELLARKLMPSLNVRCVLMDDGDGVSDRSAAVLTKLGYSDISILSGGAPAWAAAGYTLFKGVNLPSKTFGELVEHKFQTPHITAKDLNKSISDGSDLIILDGRSGPEYLKMSIPTAQSCPNAELGYRLSTLCKDPKTPVIINCAGRTRSIIGAQTLALLNIPNPVFALENGTQGWRLAGFDLVHGKAPAPLPKPSTKEWNDGRTRAEKLCRDYGLRRITNVEAQEWLADSTRSTYLFDVRSEIEFADGHAMNARSAPGGQLVQATDEQLAVRNARIILSCDNGLRSATTAIWLAGMGHDVWLLDIDTPMDDTSAPPIEAMKIINQISVEELKDKIQAGAKILDASKGLDYRAGHIDGAVWVTRAQITEDMIGDPQNLVVVGQSSTLVSGIVTEIRTRTGSTPTGIHVGTPDAWQSAGLNIIVTPDIPSEANCIDHLFFVHDRHDGNLESARRYLEWETGLLDQLDDQERSALRPLEAKA